MYYFLLIASVWSGVLECVGAVKERDPFRIYDCLTHFMMLTL